MKSWLLIIFAILINHSVNAQTGTDTDLLGLILLNDPELLEASISEADYARYLVINGKLALIAPDKYSEQLLSALPKTKKEAGIYYQVTSILLTEEILEENNAFSDFQKFLSIENLTTLFSDSMLIKTEILKFMLASSDFAWSDEFIEPVDSLILKYPDSFFAVLGSFTSQQQQEILCPIIEISPSTLIGEIKSKLSKEQLGLFTCKY